MESFQLHQKVILFNHFHNSALSYIIFSSIKISNLDKFQWAGYIMCMSEYTFNWSAKVTAIDEELQFEIITLTNAGNWF